MYAVTPIQVFSFTLSVLTLIVGILCAKRFPKIAILIYPFLTYVIHTIIFYSFLTYTTLAKTMYEYAALINGWSSGIRLHLLLLMLAASLYLYFGGKKWTRSP